MKQTVIPTKWERIFHLYIRGILLFLGIVIVFNTLGLLLMTLSLQYTNFGEEQIATYMPILMFGTCLLGSVLGYIFQKKHLLQLQYNFSMKKINFVCVVSQLYAAILYFVIIAVF